MRRVNGGLAFGRTWIGFRRAHPSRYAARRITWRSGGQRTPGPWWELEIPHVGSFVLSLDRTLFGWDDPATPSGDR